MSKKNLFVIACLAATLTLSAASAQPQTPSPLLQRFKRCLGGSSTAAKIRRCATRLGINLPRGGVALAQWCLAYQGFDRCATLLGRYLPRSGSSSRRSPTPSHSARPSSAKLLKGVNCLKQEISGQMGRLRKKGGYKGKNIPQFITDTAAERCVSLHNLNVGKKRLKACLSVTHLTTGLRECLLLSWGRPPTPNTSPTPPPTVRLPTQRLNLHIQEDSDYVALSLGALMLPMTEKDQSVWLFMWGLQWQRVHRNLTHSTLLRAALNDANHVVGLQYGLGVGPAHGIVHVGFNAGAKLIHLFHQYGGRDIHTFGFGFSLGGFIDFTPLMFTGHFWKGLFDPLEAAKAKIGDRVIAGILEGFRFRLWMNWEAAVLGHPKDGPVLKAGGLSLGLSLAFKIN